MLWTDTIPVTVHLAKAKPGVERTRRRIVGLDLQRGIGSASLLCPGADLVEQRCAIALLSVFGSCYDIHNTECLRGNDADGAGNQLIAIPECGEDSWVRRSAYDGHMRALLLRQLSAELAVKHQPILQRLAPQDSS